MLRLVLGSLVLFSAVTSAQSAIIDLQEITFARAGNNTEAAKAAGNNIYLGLLPGERIAMLYVPWPYAETVDDNTIARIFRGLAETDDNAAYIRSRFDLLKQKAVVAIEPFHLAQDEVVFECSALAPCRLRLRDGYVEMIRPGIINEHIVRYDPLLSE